MKKQTKTTKKASKLVKTTQKAAKTAINNLAFLTRAELASELYDLKKKTGANLTPVGRTKPLTRAEFTKRYLNGVGGTKGFCKEELISLTKRYQKIANEMGKKQPKSATKTTAKTTTKKPSPKKAVKKPAKKSVAKKK